MNRDWSQRFLPPIPQMKKLYVMQNGEPDTLKIGTSYDPEARARVSNGNHRTLTVVTRRPVKTANAKRKYGRQELKPFWLTGIFVVKWYRVTLDEGEAGYSSSKGYAMMACVIPSYIDHE